MSTTIGERVRTYRLRRGLTQARLAHLIGRSERWLIDVEQGGVDPRLSDALALARELCVAVDDLAGGSTPVDERAGRPPPQPPVQRSTIGPRFVAGRGAMLRCVWKEPTYLWGRRAPRLRSSFLTSSRAKGGGNLDVLAGGKRRARLQ